MAGYSVASVADGVTIQAVGGVLSILSVPGSKIAAGVDRKATGTSASGTPGTAVASLTATSGNRLANVTIAGNGAASANTFLRIVVTYDDNTTTTVDTTGTGYNIGGNSAGVQVAPGAVAGWTAYTAFDTTKGIKSVVATTLGAGTGARTCSLTAVEVALA